jgi:fructokinase
MILCCGEALIDMLPCLTQGGESAFAPHTGGAAFNTAIALGRLGAQAGLLCGLSSDMFGTLLANRLAASGVSTAFCPRSDRPTTLAFVTLTDGQARYAFYDENSAMRMLHADDLPVLGANVTTLLFGGISLVPEPCGSAFEALAQREAPARAIMLDPNIRPAVIADESTYRARLMRMIGLSDILKLSEEDLEWLMPGLSRHQAVKALRAAGPSLILLTRGADGAEAHHRGRLLQISALPVQVVDTVGAGDTFNAGFLVALDKAGALTRDALANLPDAILHDALALATRAACVTVSHAGANPHALGDWYTQA